jgi:CRISPR-associated protein Cas6
VAFDLTGSEMPTEHAGALAAAVAAWLPWLDGDGTTGIHPLRTAATSGGMVVIARRAKLVLRVPAQRAADSHALCGRDLRVISCALRAGAARDRPLLPWSTLYAHRIVTGASDEREFEGDVARWLEREHVRCRFIGGGPRTVRIAGIERRGFGLALHDVAPEDSLRIQAAGFGEGRTLGCGIFVPHKAISTQP